LAYIALVEFRNYIKSVITPVQPSNHTRKKTVV